MPHQVLRIRSVAGNNYHAPAILNTVPVGGRDRPMVHQKRIGRQAVLLKHQFAFFRARYIDHMSNHAVRLGGNYRFAMMTHAILAVQLVRFAETMYNPLYSRWSVNVKRSWAAVSPTHGHGLTQIADVIRMKMREQHRR